MLLYDLYTNIVSVELEITRCLNGENIHWYVFNVLEPAEQFLHILSILMAPQEFRKLKIDSWDFDIIQTLGNSGLLHILAPVALLSMYTCSKVKMANFMVISFTCMLLHRVDLSVKPDCEVKLNAVNLIPTVLFCWLSWELILDNTYWRHAYCSSIRI